MARDWTLLYFAPEWLVRFGLERRRPTRTDVSKVPRLGQLSCEVNRRVVGSNPNKVGKILNMRF